MSLKSPANALPAQVSRLYLILPLACWATINVALAIIGVARAYSVVPYADMWDGYLGFFFQANDYNWRAWWEPHNEHRILLARALFWLDLRYLQGAGWSLVVVNCMLLAVVALIFYRLLRARAATPFTTPGQIALGLGLAGWLFSWMQSENLVWGFQCQFILAQLLPLCAFYLLHKSLGSANQVRYFVLANVFGVLSIATMANGVLALPLMLVYAIYLRQGWLRICTLLLLSAGALFLYFYGYHSPPAHGSLLMTMREAPVRLLHYVLYYLGGPFFYLFGAKALGRLAAIIGGIYFLFAAARVAVRELRRRVKDSLALMLLLFLLYIVGSAVGTAGGRAIFGVSQALTSRYTTPTLMAWATLMVLYAPTLHQAGRQWTRRAVFPYALVALLLGVVQLPALRSQQAMLDERRLAALALALGINDQVQIDFVYPRSDRALLLAETASQRRLSIFGMYPYNQVKQELGTKLPQRALPRCQGYLDRADKINTDSRYVRVHGVMSIAQQQAAPKLIRFLDLQRRVVGYALINEGAVIPSTHFGAENLGAVSAHYSGYLLAGSGVNLTMEAERPDCQISIIIPPASSTSTKGVGRSHFHSVIAAVPALTEFAMAAAGQD
ncbi:MAG: hypothetical protein V4754_12925 [Pseudomonadota bacterium]